MEQINQKEDGLYRKKFKHVLYFKMSDHQINSGMVFPVLFVCGGWGVCVCVCVSKRYVKVN